MLLPLAVLAAAAHAAVDIEEDFKLVASDGAGGDEGTWSALTVSGTTALFGARKANPSGVSDAGAVYVWTTSDGGSTWVQTHILTASDKASSDRFGSAVAMSGNVIMVGAYFEDPSSVSGAGSAYVYVTSDGGSTWVQTQKLTASDKSGSDFFGRSVGMMGDYAVIGAFSDDPGGVGDAGSAYAFKTSDGGSTWTQSQKLTASDKGSPDRFGSASALWGDIIVVGAYWNDPSGVADAGAAYTYVTSDGGASWPQTQKLTALDKASGDWLGLTVAVYGDIIVSGARNHDPASVSNAGAAYVFKTSDGGSSWTQTQKLTALDKTAGDLFGSYAAVSGDRVLVGAGGRSSNNGAAMVFETADSGSTWTQVSTITASDGFNNAFFGETVALDAGFAFVGAYDSSGATPGAAYFALVGAVPGSGGDPVFVDFDGHRFLAGDAPGMQLPLFAFGRDKVMVETGTVRGRENGYFLDAVVVERAGVGSARIAVTPGELSTTVSGDEAVVSAMARGDNGLVVVSIENGQAVVGVKPHASNGFSFVNVKILFATEELKHGCTGMLCDEAHLATV